MKTALLLNVVDPRIGGVLISGSKGSAKSTLARALAAILPDDAEGRRPPLVTLPLGASEERLTGSLDLQRVLAEREASFQEGLLARATVACCTSTRSTCCLTRWSICCSMWRPVA